MRPGQSPMEYFHDCLNAISKQALHDARNARAMLVNSEPNKNRIEINSDISKEQISDAFYASAGRRYGTDNRKINNF